MIWAVGSVDKWIVHDVQSCQPWMQRSLYNVAPSSSQKGLISAVCVILISLDLRAILSVGAKKGFTCGQSQTPISVHPASNRPVQPMQVSTGARTRWRRRWEQQNQNPMAFSIRLPDSWSDLKHKKLSIRTISIQTASIERRSNVNTMGFNSTLSFQKHSTTDTTLVSLLREQALLSKQGGNFEKSSKQAGWKFLKNKQADVKQIGQFYQEYAKQKGCNY